MSINRTFYVSCRCNPSERGRCAEQGVAGTSDVVEGSWRRVCWKPGDRVRPGRPGTSQCDLLQLACRNVKDEPAD